ncbi:unnamed protein product [Victoria cruziana]
MLRDSGDEGIFTIPGFSQIQFEGFCRFIDQGLMEKLHQFPKIKDTDQEIEFQLFGESYQLVEPLIKERDVVYESITYSFELYVPVVIYRIVIDQILQSSGIYYSTGLDHNGISVYTGTIISDWGGRSELEIDRKERIWACVSKKQKISILILSSAMSSSLSEILGNVCYPKIFLSFPNEKEKKKISSKENAILEFYQKFACVGGDPVFSKCELGRIGRKNMNQRPNLDIPQNNTFLLPRDVLATANHLIRMKFGMGTLDDMNHLKNKCIRSVTDLSQDQFGLALIRLENVVRGSICGAIRHKLIPTSRNLVTSTPLTTTYESLFGIHPLSQVLDRTNPLTQIVHGQKSSYLGLGGLTRRTASFRVRDIHPSHYGRICPIDTSARVGDWGSIETPFYEIFERSKEEPMVYLSPSRDEYYMVAAGNSLALTRGLQEEEVGPTRYSALDLGGSAIAECEENIIYTDAEKIFLSANGDSISISLVMYQRSNKNTWMHQKPQVHRVAYMPWEGYNFEDAVLISKRLVYDNIYTSFHIQKYEIQTHVTSQGPERITNEIPHLEPYLLRNLDKNGIVMLGSWAKTGDILVGKLMPQTAKESSYAPEDRLLRAILGIQVSTAKETCLKLPIGGRGRVIDVRWGKKKGMFECSLGLAGDLQGRHYKIMPLDERYEQEASRKLVFSELYEASKQTANPWLFEPYYPVKSIRFNGRTGDPFEQPVIIGKSYMLKLIHQVDDKIHGCSSGHYALVIQQSFRGRAKQGGQRVGEMEVWALEGFGVAHILQEILTYKSDHIRAHQEVLGTTIVGGTIPDPEGVPESFRLLVREL